MRAVVISDREAKTPAQVRTAMSECCSLVDTLFGDEASAALRTRTYDIVVICGSCDLVRRLLAEMRASPSLRSIPVLAVLSVADIANVTQDDLLAPVDFIGASAQAREIALRLRLLVRTSRLLTAPDITPNQDRDWKRMLDEVERAAGLVTWEWNIQTNAVYLSQAAYELNGQRPEEFGASLEGFMANVHPEDREYAGSHIQRSIATGEPFDYEYRLVRPNDGAIRWHRGRGHVTHDAAGVPHRMFGTDEDITDRKEAEQLRDWFQALQETSPDLVAFWKPNGDLAYVNPAGRRMMGLAADAGLTGRRIIDAHTAVSRALLEREGIPTALRDQVWIGELSLPAGSADLPVLAMILAHRDSRGQTAFLCIIERDISERKALEARLLHSQKQEAIGRLAAGIAHDFNNLLTVIIGSVDMVRRGRAPHAHADLLSATEQAAHQAARLTRQLLTFARRQIVAPQVFSVNERVLALEDLLHRLIGEDLKLIVDARAESVLVHMDPDQLDQILVNLAVNARDAMPRGGELRIRTWNETDASGKPCLGLSVTDTGVGMTQEVLAHAFEPFYTTKDRAEGTGLGLATCHGIVQQAGGRIGIESEVGKGTTVKILLPLTSERLDVVTKHHAARQVVVHDETILVVEDEALVRTFASECLRSAGYRVVSARDASEALMVLATTPKVDLVVTDVVLPGMNGVELARKLEDVRPGLKVLFASGYSDDTLSSHGVLKEGVRMLEKPYTANALSEAVYEAITS